MPTTMPSPLASARPLTTKVPNDGTAGGSWIAEESGFSISAVGVSGKSGIFDIRLY